MSCAGCRNVNRPSGSLAVPAERRGRAMTARGAAAGSKQKMACCSILSRRIYTKSTAVRPSTPTPTCAPDGGPLTEALCLKVKYLSRRRDVVVTGATGWSAVSLPHVRRGRPHFVRHIFVRHAYTGSEATGNTSIAMQAGTSKTFAQCLHTGQCPAVPQHVGGTRVVKIVIMLWYTAPSTMIATPMTIETPSNALAATRTGTPHSSSRSTKMLRARAHGPHSSCH